MMPGAWLPLLLAACPAPLPLQAPGRQDAGGEEPRMRAATFEGLAWRSLGPAFMSGRIADIALDPRRRSTWYVAAGSGNLWKTTNAGTTWKPVFDDQGSYSLGCVTLDPSRPDTVWLGTGENVGGRHVGYGDGVYRSRDGGASWEKMGLEASEHIARILVDPRDPDTVFVAAQGPLWSPGGDRGLFRTTDGGASWTKILGGGEFTGVTDVVMDPRDPDILYAATHQRLRSVAALVNGGPESGIHKSIDGGATWRRLTQGLPEEDMGKIGLAVSPQKPEVVYATIELARRKGGFWRSADGGESWEKRSDYLSGGTGAHYYQEVYASPHRFDRVYQADVRLHVSEDGGTTWKDVDGGAKHVDNHAVAFDPTDPDWLLVGCDGGLYETHDLARTWRFHANLPVTQFYKLAVDDDVPFYNVYGGTQDNSTQGGPSRTDTVNGISNSDWFITVFADGHQPAVDPSNPDIVYSEWQEGNLVRHDRRTGEIVYIQPQPGEGESWERFNWDSPILISPHDPARLYYASQRVWRSDDRGDSWQPVSGDLTRGLDRLQLPLMGRVWSYDAVWDLSAMSKFGTVTALAESPLVEGLLYAGTDDGRIQFSEDGGATWRLSDAPSGVPEFFFVNDLKADLFAADTVYAALDLHKQGNFQPFLLKSTDRGRHWESIAGDLPARHVVWRLVQDHGNPALLFAATEFGVFFTVDGGGHWIKLGGGVPNVAFRDLAIQRRETDLVGATFGRGLYVLDDYRALREVSEQALDREAVLFPVRRAWWYVERRPLGEDGKATQGDAWFAAENPPYGAVFTYYLRDDIKTRAEARRDAEKKVAEEGGDTPFPGWDAVRAEDWEEEPVIVFTVRDAAGEVVRRLTGPVTAGFHRVAWDLRLPPPAPPGDEDDNSEDRAAEGLLAAPGTYSVSLAKRVAGRLADLGQSRSFEVVPLRSGSLPGASPEEAAGFLKDLAQVQRRFRGAREAVAESLERAGAMRRALMESAVDDEDVEARVRALETRLREMQETLNGRRDRRVMNDPGPVSVSRRLDVAVMGNRWSTYGPTPTHRRSLGIARKQLAALKPELDRIVRQELPELGIRLSALGVHWTAGRSMPR